MWCPVVSRKSQNYSLLASWTAVGIHGQMMAVRRAKQNFCTPIAANYINNVIKQFVNNPLEPWCEVKLGTNNPSQDIVPDVFQPILAVVAHIKQKA